MAEGKMKGRWCKTTIELIAVLILSQFTTKGVVFFSTGDPQYNTTAPTGALAGSGWDLQGQSFPGVPIAPNFFITAMHVGGKVGDTFALNGVQYPMVASFSHPDVDLTIWQVNGTFPSYAPLYTGSDEVGKSLVVFGHGAERGSEVLLNGILKGWLWGKEDGILRWGENVVSGISDEDGNPATDATTFQLLRADFDSTGGPNEADLSGGDSGGGVFIRDADGVWKLAGVNHSANQRYSETAAGPVIDATLFDEGGYYEQDPGRQLFRPDNPSNPQPGSFYATRISKYAAWIEGVVSGSGGPDNLVLEGASNLLGPYTPVAGATIDPDLQMIIAPRPDGTRFFRVRGDRAYMIQRLDRSGESVVISYQ